MTRILKLTCMASALLLISNCSLAQKPTKKDITKAMKTVWDKPETRYDSRTSIEINDIKIGTSEKSNYAQQLEGVPKGALVTHAKIDFTQSIFDTGNTRKSQENYDRLGIQRSIWRIGGHECWYNISG